MPERSLPNACICSVITTFLGLGTLHNTSALCWGLFERAKVPMQKHKNAKNVTLNRQRILVYTMRSEIRKSIALLCKLGTCTSDDLDFSLLCTYPRRPQVPQVLILRL